MMKFEVGSIYVRPGLFGPSFLVKCMSRTDTTVSFVEVGFDTDTPDEIELEFDFDQDTEVCECWEYMKHKGYIFASNCVG